MSNIDKQWLQQTISDMEEHRNLFPGDLDDNHENVLAALRIALASHEAEPAIHRWRRVTVEPYGPYPWHYGNFIGFSKPVEGIEDEYYYSAPPAPVSVPDDIDARMKNAGMLSAAEIIAGQPIDAFMKHAGVVDLSSLLKWAEMRRAEFLRMQAKYELGDNQKDDMYEWVISHVAAFSELHVNLRAAMLQSFGNSEQLDSPVIPDGWKLVPIELTPRMITKLQQNTEIGSYIAANWAGAYGLFQKFWDEAIAAAPQQEVKP
ncbi:TPA: hypothetical protein ACXIYC_002493 [Enterobacter cloacae]